MPITQWPDLVRLRGFEPPRFRAWPSTRCVYQVPPQPQVGTCAERLSAVAPAEACEGGSGASRSARPWNRTTSSPMWAERLTIRPVGQIWLRDSELHGAYVLMRHVRRLRLPSRRIRWLAMSESLPRSGRKSRMVGSRGFAPPRGWPHRLLRPARLLVPPRACGGHGRIRTGKPLLLRQRGVLVPITWPEKGACAERRGAQRRGVEVLPPGIAPGSPA